MRQGQKVAVLLHMGNALQDLSRHQEAAACDAAVALHPDYIDLREKLAANRATAPLFDMARFTRDIEAAYITMLASKA